MAADASNCIVYANYAVASLLGWEPGALIGQPLVTIIPPRLRAVHTAAFERYIRTGEPRIIGHPIRVPALARDGSEIDIELSLAAHAAAGEEPLIVASLRDLRTRVELERQLAVTGYLRAATEAAARLTTLLDLDHVLRIVVDTLAGDFDSALARIWLYDAPANELVLLASAGLSTATTSSSRARIDVATYPFKLGRIARQRTPFIQNGLLGDPEFDQEWVRREGIVSVAIFPLLYAGELLGLLASFWRRPLPDELIEVLAAFAAITTTSIHDVEQLEHEHKIRAEAEAAERRAAFLAEAGSVLASSLDYETTLTNVAQLAVASLADWCVVDVTAGDGSIQRVVTAYSGPEQERIAEGLRKRYPDTVGAQRVIERGQPEMISEITPEMLERGALDAEHLTMLQRLAPLSYMSVPLVARKRSLGAITFLTGRSSGRIYGPADLALAEDLAGRAAVAVDNARLYRDLEEAIRDRDDFLSSVSHDLQNPLTTIKARAQLMQRRLGRIPKDEAERLTQGLEVIDATAGKMSRLINDLVDLVHLRIGRPLTLRREEIDLVDLGRQVATEQQATQDRNIRFESDLQHLTAMLDAARVERILVNLLSNAAKYSSPESDIVLRIGRESDPDVSAAVISVSDKGIGIPARDLPRIFERFYRASNAGDVEGTGIGLAGVRQIVEHHGGSIEVESEEGEGATFTVRLPIGREG